MSALFFLLWVLVYRSPAPSRPGACGGARSIISYRCFLLHNSRPIIFFFPLCRPVLHICMYIYIFWVNEAEREIGAPSEGYHTDDAWESVGVS
ncbi:hypothetical protein V8C35DRAFT_29492 [Trichoderma chlorosporum]